MAIFVLASLVMLLIVLSVGRIPAPVAFVTLASLYLLTGVVELPVMLSSFSNPALATLILLVLISLTLERSPLLDLLAAHILSGREKTALTKLMGTTAVLSAFLNNTAVVASFLGALSRQRKIPPSRILIPLSYASILGGITTLIGTSTNMVVSSFATSAGLQELSMFQFSYVGIPVALAGIIVILLISSWLPAHQSETKTASLPYFLSAEVSTSSPLVGRSIASNNLRHLDGLFLLEIERNSRLITPVSPEEIVKPNDILVFTGEIGNIQTLQRFPGLKLLGENASELLADNLIEVIISHESTLANRTLQEVDFRTMFNAGVVGIRRGERRLEGQLGRIPLRVGDSLLLAVGGDFNQHRNVDKNFHLLSETLQRPKLSLRQSIFALTGFASAIIFASVGVMSLFEALLCLIAVFLFSGLLSAQEMRRRFPFELFLMIGSALTIAKGMESSGAANFVALGMQYIFNDYGIYASFVGIFLLTLILTETVTNTAAAALVFPIALSTAQAFNADPTPFVMVVAYGASACFLIPFGYQTHLMVYTPGRYRLSNYLTIGIPVSIIYAALVIVLTPIFFPFTK
mgnify:CR=1 FL=1